MKRILLSLLTASSLTTATLPALADRVYVQAGPIGFSVQEYDRAERHDYRPYYVERHEYHAYYHGERHEYHPYYHGERREHHPYYYGERR